MDKGENMTKIANIASRILSENGYPLADFTNLTLTILEYKVQKVKLKTLVDALPKKAGGKECLL